MNWVFIGKAIDGKHETRFQDQVGVKHVPLLGGRMALDT